MNKKYILPLLVVVAVLSACSSATETGPPCSIENEMALQTGNWWVYQAWSTDAAGAKIAGTERIDSMVVEGTQKLLGKTAYVVVNYSSKDGGISLTRDTTWFAVEGGQAYRLSSDLGKLFCDCLQPTWVKFASCEQDSWTALDTTMETRQPSRLVDNSGKELIVESVMKSTYKTTGMRGASTAFTVGTTSVQAREYSLYNIFDAQLVKPDDAYFMDEVRTRRVLYTNQSRIWAAANIGIVKVETTAYQREPASTMAKVFPGFVRNLLRYSVK